MPTLRELIDQAGKRSDSLKIFYDRENYPPSNEQLSNLPIDEQYTLRRKGFEFTNKMNVEIYAANYHLIQLIKAYLSEPNLPEDEFTSNCRTALQIYEKENECRLSDMGKYLAKLLDVIG